MFELAVTECQEYNPVHYTIFEKVSHIQYEIDLNAFS